MTLSQNVKDAVKEFDAVHDQRFAPWRGQWQTIRAHLLSQDAELKILRVKCSGTLANNLCPDHRDKQVGNPCLACTIEKLQSRLAAANERLETTERTLERCKQTLDTTSECWRLDAERLEAAEMDAVRYRWLKMSAPAGFQYQLIRTPWTSWDSQIGDGINDMLLANNINARIANE